MSVYIFLKCPHAGGPCPDHEHPIGLTIPPGRCPVDKRSDEGIFEQAFQSALYPRDSLANTNPELIRQRWERLLLIIDQESFEDALEWLVGSSTGPAWDMLIEVVQGMVGEREFWAWIVTTGSEKDAVQDMITEWEANVS